MSEFNFRLQSLLNNESWIAAIKRKDRRLLKVEPYTYSTTIDYAIGTNIVGTSEIRFEREFDFAALYQGGAAFDVTNSVGLSSVDNSTVQLRDEVTGQTLYNVPTQYQVTFGGAGFPFLLPVPRVFQGGTRLSIAGVTTSAVILRLTYAWIGAALFYAT